MVNYGVGFAGWRGDAGVGTWAEVGSVDQLGRGWLNGYRIWTAELFDPAVKADRDSPDFVGAVRLPANTLFKKEVANSSEGGRSAPTCWTTSPVSWKPISAPSRRAAPSSAAGSGSIPS